MWIRMVFLLLVLLGHSGVAHTEPPKAENYASRISDVSKRRDALTETWRAGSNANLENVVRAELISTIEDLSAFWLGTRWALGSPQTSTPQRGKINCGTFVGRVLHDAGFNVNVRKLQRQPSQLIIKSFVSGERVRKFSNKSMKTFLASVREMGPGLFIIGLDFHVGFLLQTEDDLRFIHASFETETVVNEDAASAMPIVTSGYKVVGKILSPGNIRSWLRGDEIVVKGDW